MPSRSGPHAENKDKPKRASQEPHLTYGNYMADMLAASGSALTADRYPYATQVVAAAGDADFRGAVDESLCESI